MLQKNITEILKMSEVNKLNRLILCLFQMTCIWKSLICAWMWLCKGISIPGHFQGKGRLDQQKERTSVLSSIMQI